MRSHENVYTWVCVWKSEQNSQAYTVARIFFFHRLYILLLFFVVVFLSLCIAGRVLFWRRGGGMAWRTLNYTKIYLYSRKMPEQCSQAPRNTKHRTAAHIDALNSFVCSRYALIRHVVYGRRMPPKHIYSPLRRVIKISGGVSIRSARESGFLTRNVNFFFGRGTSAVIKLSIKMFISFWCWWIYAKHSTYRLEFK